MASWVKVNKAEVLDEFVEIESGAKSDRVQLAQALKLAKRQKATLVIAKLDRLSRNASFLLSLRDSGVEFVCTDMPEANRLTIGIMAVMAEHEREMISERTKAAMAAYKARCEATGEDYRVGNPNGFAATHRVKGPLNWTRTSDPLINSQLLYQLSYQGTLEKLDRREWLGLQALNFAISQVPVCRWCMARKGWCCLPLL